MPDARSSSTSAGTVRDLGGVLRASRPTAARGTSAPRCCTVCETKALQQRRRDVVDAVAVEVLEHVQRHALARAGQAADDDESHHAGCLPAARFRLRRPRRRSAGMVVGQLFLVLDHAAVELVGQRVDGGIHVAVDRIGMDAAAADVHGRLGLVLAASRRSARSARR